MRDEERIRQKRLADRFEIQDVIYRWCRAIDRCDWGAMRPLFHDDAVDDHSLYCGDIDGMIEWLIARHPAITRCQHSVSNMLIEFAGSVVLGVAAAAQNGHATSCPLMCRPHATHGTSFITRMLAHSYGFLSLRSAGPPYGGVTFTLPLAPASTDASTGGGGRGSSGIGAIPYGGAMACVGMAVAKAVVLGWGWASVGGSSVVVFPQPAPTLAAVAAKRIAARVIRRSASWSGGRAATPEIATPQNGQAASVART